MGVLSKEEVEKMFLIKKYYHEHPHEAVEDHLKLIELGNDDFIMKKIEKWLKEKE